MSSHNLTHEKESKNNALMGRVFGDAEECILIEILSQGETINAACYIHTLRTLTVHCMTDVQRIKNILL
jgi:hypothetical protein